MNTARMALDTNVIILFLHGDRRVTERVRMLAREGTRFYIAALTLAELLIFKNLTQEEEDGIFDFVSLTTVVPTDEGIAIDAGRIGRDEGLRLGDGIIAATALRTGSVLLTHDKKDFTKVKTITTELI